MTNLLAAANLLVKCGIDEPVSQSGMSARGTIGDRLRQIIQDSDGKWSARGLSAQIGASPAYVESIINGRSKSPEADKLHAIAEATGYRLEWIMTGEGPPTLRMVTKTEGAERYHVMPLVRAAARAEGFEEEFVSNFEVDLNTDFQPTFDPLWSLCKSAYESWKRQQRGAPRRGSDPLDGLDDPSTRRKR